MTRLLTSGWENRSDHPQRTGWSEGHDGSVTPYIEFPAGGVACHAAVAGLGFIKFNATGWDIWCRWVWIKVDYSVSLADELFIWLHMKPWSSTHDRAEHHCRIYWDNSGASDAGYLDLSAHGNYIKWDWSGTSQQINMAIDDDQWYAVGIRVKVVPGGNDLVQIWLDGLLKFDYTGDLTVGFDEMDQISLYGYVRHPNYNRNPTPRDGFDNLIVNDENGLEDRTIAFGRYLIGRIVTGAGTHTELSAEPPGPNWSNVDEIPPDDADWVEDYESGRKDSYRFANITTHCPGNDVYKVVIRGRHDVTNAAMLEADAGFKALIRDGGDHFGSLKVAAGTIENFEEIWHLNPDTGDDWEAAEVDALEAGAQVI